MCDKTMENYKPNMFQLQCLKALEIQIEEGKGYNEAEIGRKMQVNRSTISRCFKRYREEGFLEDKGFTRILQNDRSRSLPLLCIYWN